MIAEVLGMKEGELQLHPLFEFVEDSSRSSQEKVVGELRRIGELVHCEKCHMAGISATIC